MNRRSFLRCLGIAALVPVVVTKALAAEPVRKEAVGGKALRYQDEKMIAYGFIYGMKEEAIYEKLRVAEMHELVNRQMAIPRRYVINVEVGNRTAREIEQLTARIRSRLFDPVS